MTHPQLALEECERLREKRIVDDKHIGIMLFRDKSGCTKEDERITDWMWGVIGGGIGILVIIIVLVIVVLSKKHTTKKKKKRANAEVVLSMKSY